MATNFPDTSVDNTFVTPNRPWADGDIFDDTAESGLIYYWYDPVWKTKAEGDIAAGDLTVSSLNSGPLAGFRNQIINGDFRVWQRGTSFTRVAGETGPTFLADRWLGFNDGNFNQTETTPDGFTFGITADALIGLRQYIELDKIGSNGKFFIGTTWTLSVWATADLPNSARTAPLFRGSDGSLTDSPNNTNIATIENWVSTGETSNGYTRYSSKITVTGTIASTNAAIEAYIEIPANSSCTGVQLEPGPVATPFEHRPIGIELALCKRYYQQGQHFMRAQPNTQLSGTVQAVPSFRVAPSINTSVTAGTSLTAFRATESSFLWEAVPDGFGQVDFTYTATAEL